MGRNHGWFGKYLEVNKQRVSVIQGRDKFVSFFFALNSISQFIISYLMSYTVNDYNCNMHVVI